jgi:Uma2 family endonuclease
LQFRLLCCDRPSDNLFINPDLAIEVDVTSKTGLDAYQGLSVPELWRVEEGKLRISILQDTQYVDSDVSPCFPNFPLRETISELLERSQTEGRSPTLKAFRRWVQDRM